MYSIKQTQRQNKGTCIVYVGLICTYLLFLFFPILSGLLLLTQLFLSCNHSERSFSLSLALLDKLLILLQRLLMYARARVYTTVTVRKIMDRGPFDIVQD